MSGPYKYVSIYKEGLRDFFKSSNYLKQENSDQEIHTLLKFLSFTY